MVKTSGLNSNFINSSSKDEEFDLKLFFNFLRRNVKILTLISIISIFSGYLLSFLPKRTWEGQFQIVLTSESNNNNSLSNIAPSLEVFTGGNAANNLRTEVGILRSPSTLMPAFEIYLSKNDNFSNNHY